MAEVPSARSLGPASLTSVGLALFLALATAHCGGSDDVEAQPEGRAAENSQPGAPRLLVMISIDTLRPDHLGSYGYERPTSPALDRVAAAAVSFDAAISTAPWTLPAHGSLLTGLYPRRHGLRAHKFRLPKGIPTLASLLREQGFATAAAVNSKNLSERHRLNRGFDDFLYVKETAKRRKPNRKITKWGGRRLSRWEGRGFLFLHYYDVHSDYASLPEIEQQFARPYEGVASGETKQLNKARKGALALGAADVPRLVDLYDAGIRQLDDELGRFLTHLDDAGLTDETLLVVTSDHGEEFFEHGSWLHGVTQYEEALRVPLIMRGPGLPEGLRIGTPVSLIDVVPTVLTLLGVEVPPGLDGVDLSPLWRGDGDALGDRYLFGGSDHRNEAKHSTHAVRHRNFKLHFERVSGEFVLYDLEQDPGERVDVSEAHPEVAADLLARLAVHRKRPKPKNLPLAEPLAPKEKEALQELGYLE